MHTKKNWKNLDKLCLSQYSFLDECNLIILIVRRFQSVSDSETTLTPLLGDMCHLLKDLFQWELGVYVYPLKHLLWVFSTYSQVHTWISVSKIDSQSSACIVIKINPKPMIPRSIVIARGIFSVSNSTKYIKSINEYRGRNRNENTLNIFFDFFHFTLLS